MILGALGIFSISQRSMLDAEVPPLAEEPANGRKRSDTKTAPLPWPTIIAIIVIVACQCTATRIVDLPLTRLIESRYCTRYYTAHDPDAILPDGTVPEELCKIDVVQQQMAWLLGAIVTIHVLADMLVTLPLAAVSEKYGRRLVFMLNTTGLLLMGIALLAIGFFKWPIELALIAPAFTLIGGGDCVFLSVLVTTMTDITKDPLVRTSLFSYSASVVYVSTVLSPLLAATIMSLNLLVPFLIAGALLSVALYTARWIPGRQHSPKIKQDSDEDEPLLAQEGSPVQSHPTRTDSSTPSVIRQALRGIAKRPKFRLLLGVFFLASFASSSSQLLVQYISKRYGWTIARAGVLLSAKAVVNVLLLTAIVPFFVALATSKLQARPIAINVTAAQICVAISIAGALWIALAGQTQLLIPGLVVYALGSALPVFTELLVRAPEIAGDDGVSAQDFSVAILCKTFGTLLGTPIMTIVWAESIHAGNAALGLPFYASSVTYAIAFILLLALGAK